MCKRLSLLMFGFLRVSGIWSNIRYRGQGQDSGRYGWAEHSLATTDELILNCCNHDTDPLLNPPKGTDPKRGPLWGSETGPQTMSPHSWGTQIGGPKMTCKSGPSLGAQERSLVLQISRRLYLRVTPKAAVTVIVNSTQRLKNRTQTS